MGKECFKLTDLFIHGCMEEAIYQLKEGTSTSIYWLSGSRTLPNRMSIKKGMGFIQGKDSEKVKFGNSIKIGEISGKFTKKEESPLKRFYPFAVYTSLFRRIDYPRIIAYGTIGISDEHAKKIVDDNGDLIVIDTDDWKLFRILYFRGLGDIPEHIEQALTYADNYLHGNKD